MSTIAMISPSLALFMDGGFPHCRFLFHCGVLWWVLEFADGKINASYILATWAAHNNAYTEGYWVFGGDLWRYTILKHTHLKWLWRGYEWLEYRVVLSLLFQSRKLCPFRAWWIDWEYSFSHMILSIFLQSGIHVLDWLVCSRRTSY